MTPTFPTFGVSGLAGAVQVEPGQYLCGAYSEHLVTAGIEPSTGAVGSSHDNALAESVIGLNKTELIKPSGRWKGLDDLEIATAEWVDWFNNRRPFEYCDDLIPVEAEHAHDAHHRQERDVPGRPHRTTDRCRLHLAARFHLGHLVHHSAAGRRRHRVLLRVRMAPVRRRRLAETAGELVDFLTIAGMAAGLRQRLNARST
jgi:hypothetical protein